MKILYPPHNKRDYGIEQDFAQHLTEPSSDWTIAESSDVADWHYLPIYWTRYHVTHNYAKTGLEALQREVARRIIDDKRTFTICQYDDGPLVDLGRTVQFLGSRKGEEGIDVPLLSYPHKLPAVDPPKQWLASFAGRLRTHEVRADMQRVLGPRQDIDIQDTRKTSRFFVDLILRSYVSLCPRGWGGSSFRFYESMQLGVVPLLIGSIDTRPFKRFLNWSIMSLYARTAEEANVSLDSHTLTELLEMGRCAKKAWHQDLSFGHWHKYVFQELEALWH